MHEFADWSVGLGRWKGVPVRIHLLFVLFAVFLLLLAGTQATISVTLDSAVAVAVLLVSVAIHELAHWAVARKLGGRVHEIVMGPFGGLVRPSVPDFPQAQVLVALAGPLANLVCAAFLATFLVLLTDEPIGGLFNVFVPVAVAEGTRLGEAALRLGVWLNWLLALANLLPVFPFDGAVAYREALRQRLGARTAAVYVARSGFICAVGLVGVAWWLRAQGSQTAVPVWLAALCGAVFVAFSAHRDARRTHFVNRTQDLSLEPADATDDDWIDFLEDPVEESCVSAEAWRAEGAAADAGPWRSADDEAEEAQLDAVLARLHHYGIDSLTPEDRQLLERASLRYRSRRRNRSAEDA